MKFKLAYQKGNKYLLKMILDNGEEKWATTTAKVCSYAKGNFSEGEECEFDYENKNGQYHVKRIMKLGETGDAPVEVSNTGEGKTCSCGKKIKNDKYDNCYSCNQKNPTGGSALKSGYMKEKTPEESDRIMKLSLLATASHAVKVLTAQLPDADAVADAVIMIYNKLYNEIKK